jgi:hypothetical protein
MSAFNPVVGKDNMTMRQGLKVWLTYDDEEQSLSFLIEKGIGENKYDRPHVLQSGFTTKTAQVTLAEFLDKINNTLRQRFGGSVAPIESEPAGGWEWIQWVIKPSNKQLVDDADGVGIKRK